MVINYQDQFVPGTFEYAIHHLIDNNLDLTVFYPKFKNDDSGRPAYDPAILLKIILFGYSRSITSSRNLEWHCQHNILFKALSCDTVPHFTTIADFVSTRSSEIEALFEQVLLICDEQGLLGHELEQASMEIHQLIACQNGVSINAPPCVRSSVARPWLRID